MAGNGSGFLVVAEKFGPTIQGEGRSLGTPAVFLRLGGCNLKCGINGGWKCDTPYTWLFSQADADAYGRPAPFSPRQELTQEQIDRIYSWMLHINDTTTVRMLVITGGEPLLQDRSIAQLMRRVYGNTPLRGWRVEIETNGTLVPDESNSYISQFNVSPKLANSGNLYETRVVPEALKWFGSRSPSRATFKFVCTSQADFAEIDEIVQIGNIDPRSVYIMPEGVTVEAISGHQQLLVEETLKRGFNMTTRLHVQLWGNKRGT